MKYLHVRGYLRLWQEIGKICQGVQYEIVRRPHFRLDGEVYKCESFYTTIDKLNELFGNKFDRKLCRFGKLSCTLAILDDTQTVKQEITSCVEENAKEDVTVDLESLPEVDWDWVDSLKNTTPAKKELEAYAKPMGVDLRRNMTIDNMRKAFREHLGITE